MNLREPSRCFQETQLHGSHATVVAARSTPDAAAAYHHLRQNSTMDISLDRGSRVVPPSEDVEELPPQQFEQSFFCSGGTCFAQNTDQALCLIDKMPLEDASDFNITFKENVKVERTFEENAHFILKRQCGSGVSGQVSAHMDTSTNQSFVRKKIKDGSKVRREELKAMLKLNHPGICSLYALMVHNGAVDILMPDAGHPLRDFLKVIVQRGVSAEQYWAVVTDLAVQGFRAIDHMHENSVFHMDIKPENFLAHLNELHNPVLVLADFGSAVIGQQPVDLRLQMTPEYMASELWKLYQKVGKNAGNHGHLVQPSFDIFAFGATIYYMCTQKHLLLELQNMKDQIINPVYLQNFMQMTKMHDVGFAFKFLLMTQRAEEVPRLASRGQWVFPDIPPPPKLIEVIKRTLDPNPDTRWTSQQVISFLTGEPVADRNTCETQAGFKTPMQASDTEFGVQFDSPAVEQDLSLRLAGIATAAPVAVATVTAVDQEGFALETGDADVRSFSAQQQQQLAAVVTPVVAGMHVSPTVEPEDEDGMDVAMGRGGVDRTQPMQLNSDVDLQEMEDLSLLGACGGGEKAEIDMDMHLRVTCRQTEVPDPRAPSDQFAMEELKKEQVAAGLGPSDLQGQTVPALQPPGGGQLQFMFGMGRVVGVEGVMLRGKKQSGGQVFKLGGLGAALQQMGSPQQAGVFNIQPPPTSSLGKGGSLRCPTKYGGRKGKQTGAEFVHRGVAQTSLKPGGAAHSKNMAYLSHSKAKLMSEQEPQGPVSFFVSSSAHPNLTPHFVKPTPPPLSMGSGAASTAGTAYTMSHRGTAIAGASAGNLIPPQPSISKKRSALVNPWAVAETELPQPDNMAVQATDPTVEEGSAANMPNFSLLGLD